MNGEAIHGDETQGTALLMGGWERELAVLKRRRLGCFCQCRGWCTHTTDSPSSLTEPQFLLSPTLQWSPITYIRDRTPCGVCGPSKAGPTPVSPHLSQAPASPTQLPGGMTLPCPTPAPPLEGVFALDVPPPPISAQTPLPECHFMWGMAQCLSHTVLCAPRGRNPVCFALRGSPPLSAPSVPGCSRL